MRFITPLFYSKAAKDSYINNPCSPVTAKRSFCKRWQIWYFPPRMDMSTSKRLKNSAWKIKSTSWIGGKFKWLHWVNPYTCSGIELRLPGWHLDPLCFGADVGKHRPWEFVHCVRLYRNCDVFGPGTGQSYRRKANVDDNWWNDKYSRRRLKWFLNSRSASWTRCRFRSPKRLLVSWNWICNGLLLHSGLCTGHSRQSYQLLPLHGLLVSWCLAVCLDLTLHLAPSHFQLL